MIELEAADLYSSFAEPFRSFPAIVALLAVVLPVTAFAGYPARMEKRDPFKCFKTSREIIRLAVMPYIGFCALAAQC